MGATGKLGRYLRPHFPDALCPTRKELDITDWYSILRYTRIFTKDDTVINCAAMTDTKECEDNPKACYITNSRPMLEFSKYTPKMVYISTDHVFDGTKEMYTEDCLVNPQGHYAKSKVMGEWFTLINPNNLVIRTSFMESYNQPAAFTDKFGSWLWVDDAATEIAKAIKMNLSGIYHIGGTRKSVYDFVKERFVVEPNKLKENPIARCGLPYLVDTSLYCKKWHDANRLD